MVILVVFMSFSWLLSYAFKINEKKGEEKVFTLRKGKERNVLSWLLVISSFILPLLLYVVIVHISFYSFLCARIYIFPQSCFYNYHFRSINMYLFLFIYFFIFISLSIVDVEGSSLMKIIFCFLWSLLSVHSIVFHSILPLFFILWTPLFFIFSIL